MSIPPNNPDKASSPNGGNGADTHGGRGAGGRFAAGNTGGPGNPHGRQIAAMRRAFAGAVTDHDLEAIAIALVKKAKTGDVTAAREILNRLVGDIGGAEIEERLAALERALAAREQR